MSMYLPNPDLHPTGDEPAEFLEIPPMDQSTTGSRAPDERPQEADDRQDVQTRRDISGDG